MGVMLVKLYPGIVPGKGDHGVLPKPGDPESDLTGGERMDNHRQSAHA